MEEKQDNPAPSIEVEGLCKQYGPVTALRDVSFRIEKGEIVGFLGPNGAGKTSTLRILCGLMPATSGIARVCGVSLARDPLGARRHIGYMPESNPLPEEMRVVEYLRLRGRLKNLPGRELRRRVDEVLELCDLKRKARRKTDWHPVQGLSPESGHSRRHTCPAEVAILDEPTIGLDPHQVLTIRSLLAELRGKMTIVISSHILPEIELSCDRVIIMNNGRVVAIGTPAQLRAEFVRERAYRMEAAGDIEKLKTELTTRFPQLRISDGEPGSEGVEYRHIEAISGDGADISGELLALAAALPGVRLHSLYRREPTLEDVFLAATVRNWEAAPEARGGQKR